MTKRQSLRAFDDDAIAAEETPAAEPSPAQHRPRPAAPTPAATSSSSDVRTGIYLQADTFAAAKSAYIADFETIPASPDTFAGWVASVFDRHAGRTPEKRAELASRLQAESPGDGVNRSFTLPADTLEHIHQAIAADRRAGRVTSRSQFASEAIRSATEEARLRAGGALPPAPPRLPNKMR